MSKKVDYITPIQVLNKEMFGNKIFVKRDDLLPFSFGGNKARKGLLFFEEIERNTYNYVVTYGTEKSNHCRIISNLAAAKGIACMIISPLSDEAPSYNREIVSELGASVKMCPVEEVSQTIDKEVKKLEVAGYKPYFIQGGGHGDIGTQAYVNAYEEIARYEEEHGVVFDYIFLASGTGTTQAGLVCGKTIRADEKKIIGISIARKNPNGGKIVEESANDYLAGINIDKINSKDIIFMDEYVLEGYGSYNDEILATIGQIMRSEGIPLDPTYTGKAFWGMKEYIKSHEIRQRNILFLHTGGTPLFFDYLNLKRNGGHN